MTLKNENLKVHIEITGENRLHAECSAPEQERCQYAFYIFRDRERVHRSRYTREPSVIYWPTEPGNYWARVFTKTDTGDEVAVNSDKLYFRGLRVSLNSEKENEHGLFSSFAVVLRENWKHRYRMFRIARFDSKLKAKDSKLGALWNFLTPLIQIAAYWFVFGLGIRGGKAVDGNPYLAWMLAGIIPWFIISDGLTRGTGAVFSKAKMTLEMRYPLGTLPTGSIIEVFISNAALFLLLLVTLLSYGYLPNLYWLNTIYYVIYMFVSLVGCAFIFSTLTMKARDYQLLVISSIRLLFFLTPILWSMEKLSPVFQIILQLNPFYYIIAGFRESVFYAVNFWAYSQPLLVVYYWMISLVLLLVGSRMHVRQRNLFYDML